MIVLWEPVLGGTQYSAEGQVAVTVSSYSHTATSQ